MLAVGVFFQRLPLGAEQVLHSLPKGNVLGIGPAGSLQGVRLALTQGMLPFLPAGTAVCVLQRHEQCVVRQPEAVFPDEIPVIGRGCRQQAFTGGAQYGVALLIQGAVVDLLRCALPVDVLVLFRLQQTLRCKGVKVDKIGVACVGGKGLIGAVAVACRADG